MGELMRILAVDDSAANLTTIEQELENQYEVVTVLNGRRAVKYLYQEDVDLILLDVQMPIMDGIETLREIRSLVNGSTIPVIFLTAMKDKATVIEGAKLGIMDYITKPFDADDLRKRIEMVFMKLGKFEAPLDVLLGVVNDVLDARSDDRMKVVAAKLEELSNYTTEDELHERIRHAKLKFNEGDVDTAMAIMERIRTILEKETGKDQENNLTKLGAQEVISRLMYGLSDLENFHIAKAREKLDDLVDNYSLPEFIGKKVKQILVLLDGFDDIHAEIELRELIKQLQNE